MDLKRGVIGDLDINISVDWRWGGMKVDWNGLKTEWLVRGR